MSQCTVIERVIRENPSLHYLSKEVAESHGQALSGTGLQLPPPGDFSMGVVPQVLRYMAEVVGPEDYTLETGCGHSTVALAALGKHHICISPDSVGKDKVINYVKTIGIEPGKITFIEESSDKALVGLAVPQKLAFAFVDGCHGYPFPALDWHYIDPLLKVGGIIGFDNTELRSVAHHCEFMSSNNAYQLVADIRVSQFGNAMFYKKMKSEEREWVFQQFNKGADVFPQAPLLPVLTGLKRLIKPLVRAIKR